MFIRYKIRLKGILSLEFLLYVFIVLMIVAFLININTKLVNGIKEQNIEEEYFNKIENIKKEVLTKVNGVFIDNKEFKKEQRTSVFV